MLKIKGLKKKKKGKKGKHKEDDLFDPEELEQYRREHQQKKEAAEAVDATGEGTSSEQSEEWRKFQALTGGVDDILKKTQEDLNRIKSESYFQRKPPGPSTDDETKYEKKYDPVTKKWTKFAEDGSVIVEEEPKDEPEPICTEQIKVELEEPQPVVEEEEEEESELDEDIFDTSYVDVVASGDVKLAYIPDSPTEEETGPDPFDTSIVDKVIKVDPKKRNLVSLGCAVDVLTGRVEKPIPVAEALPKKRKRPKKQDLLLGSFDEVEASDEPVVESAPPPKSILDEEPEFIPDEIDLSINLATVLPPPSPLVERKALTTEEKAQLITKSLVEEFDVVGQTDSTTVPEPEPEPEDDLDDEFAALAQESVAKAPVVVNSTSDLDEFEDGVDPFDTTFASNVLPGKFELKLIEEEILLKDHELPKVTLPKELQDIPSVTLNDSEKEHNFLEEEQAPLSFKHRDLLGGSTTDLSKISDCPIEPLAPKEGTDDLTYSDPFDTSVVDVLVAPGKTELKFLEKELLDGVISQLELDDDFDPRADDPPKPTKPVTRPDQLPVGEKRLSISKVVAFKVDQPETDLLAVDQEENSKVSKPLTPYYANPDEVNNRPSYESENNFEDPFDTSFASHAPGKAELKLLESELVAEPVLKHSLSDEDFDPRGASSVANLSTESQPKAPSTFQPPTSLPIKVSQPSPEKIQPDLLSEDTEITIKLHTPVAPRKIEEDLENFDYIDPFDTSIVKDVLPGKAELKLLENELINSDCGTSIKRSYTDPDFNPRDSPEQEIQPKVETKNFIDHSEDISVAEKPLTPLSANSKVSFDLGADIDPFDTSCVENLVPGKAELKLLETELFN